jgi:hypothetical protein
MASPTRTSGHQDRSPQLRDRDRVNVLGLVIAELDYVRPVDRPTRGSILAIQPRSRFLARDALAQPRHPVLEAEDPGAAGAG